MVAILVFLFGICGASAAYNPVEFFTGHIVTGSNYTYVLDQSAATNYTINSFTVQTTSGTITAAVKIGSTAATGCSAISVSSSPSVSSCTANNLVKPGDRVTLVLSSNSSAVDVTFTMKITRP